MSFKFYFAYWLRMWLVTSITQSKKVEVSLNKINNHSVRNINKNIKFVNIYFKKILIFSNEIYFFHLTVLKWQCSTWKNRIKWDDITYWLSLVLPTIWANIQCILVIVNNIEALNNIKLIAKLLSHFFLLKRWSKS